MGLVANIKFLYVERSKSRCHDPLFLAAATAATTTTATVTAAHAHVTIPPDGD